MILGASRISQLEENLGATDVLPKIDGALLGAAGEAFPAIERAVGRGLLALSAEALGIMEVCRDMTLDYLRTRKQFGVPIGKFQALQHRMVDLCLEIEQARSAVMLAAGKLEAPRPERERALSAAKNLVGRVGRLVAEESIQLHGGIAMTWDYALPHFAKRLTMIDHPGVLAAAAFYLVSKRGIEAVERIKKNLK